MVCCVTPNSLIYRAQYSTNVESVSFVEVFIYTQIQLEIKLTVH